MLQEEKQRQETKLTLTKPAKAIQDNKNSTQSAAVKTAILLILQTLSAWCFPDSDCSGAHPLDAAVWQEGWEEMRTHNQLPYQPGLAFDPLTCLYRLCLRPLHCNGQVYVAKHQAMITAVVPPWRLFAAFCSFIG